MPVLRIELSFSRPQRDALTTVLNGLCMPLLGVEPSSSPYKSDILTDGR